jgi:pimeloyl-ACP methyl ester carboxylesterase
MGSYLASQIPDATVTVFEGEGHMAAFEHWTEIITALTAS